MKKLLLILLSALLLFSLSACGEEKEIQENKYFFMPDNDVIVGTLGSDRKITKVHIHSARFSSLDNYYIYYREDGLIDRMVLDSYEYDGPYEEYVYKYGDDLFPAFLKIFNADKEQICEAELSKDGNLIRFTLIPEPYGIEYLLYCNPITNGYSLVEHDENGEILPVPSEKKTINQSEGRFIIRSYDEEGRLLSEEYYEKNEMTEANIYTYDGNGVLLKKRTYPNGEYLYYTIYETDENGHKKTSNLYARDEWLTFTSIYKYEDDCLASEYTYEPSGPLIWVNKYRKSGIKETTTFYYENGNVNYVLFYNAKEMIVESNHYEDDGRLAITEYYDENEEISSYVLYDDEGNPSERIPY